jgi:hypothetical protein
MMWKNGRAPFDFRYVPRSIVELKTSIIAAVTCTLLRIGVDPAILQVFFTSSKLD